VDIGYERMKDKLLAEVKKSFRPEFLNRIDSTVVFHSLTREEIRQIVDLQLQSVIKQLKEKSIAIEITETAKDVLGKKGYDEVYGARPLRRVIQNMIEDRLSEDLLRGQFTSGDTVLIDAAAEGEELTFNVKHPEPPPVAETEEKPAMAGSSNGS
jgi:ATP-dependent Clp protease ATP-binding subunit ClpC